MKESRTGAMLKKATCGPTVHHAARKTVAEGAKQGVPAMPARRLRIGFRFTIGIKRITAGHKPIAKIRPLFFAYILSTVFTALPCNARVKMATHLAYM